MFHVPVYLFFLPFFLYYSMTVSGETALDRLANALGGKAVLPHIISIIPKMLTSGNPMTFCLCIIHFVSPPYSWMIFAFLLNFISHICLSLIFLASFKLTGSIDMVL